VPGIALSIAGSDPSGGAGLQADLKTFAAYRVYGTAVVTACTVQNTRGVQATHPVSPEIVGAQLAAVLEDLAVGAAKTGLLPDGATVRAVAAVLAGRPALPLVVDPVLVSTSGHALAGDSTLAALRHTLLPIAALVTPNLAEAAALTGRPVGTREDMRRAARALVDAGARAALVTGGHLVDSACDVFCDGTHVHDLDAPRITTASSHGTGCTLAAAVTAGLARGEALDAAVVRAKRYVTRALAGARPLGGGLHLLDHGVDPDEPS
jgi:hydroxymethylpyrimidine/phosphomethylpyrimidine kinase